MDFEKVDEALRLAFIKMHVYERNNNQISYQHIKEMLQLIYETEPINEKDMLAMLRVSIGIDKRYIRDIYNSFLAWKVIFRESGMIYADKPQKTLKEKESITISKEEYLPCSSRTENNMCARPGHSSFAVSVNRCNTCNSRVSPKKEIKEEMI